MTLQKGSFLLVFALSATLPGVGLAWEEAPLCALRERSEAQGPRAVLPQIPWTAPITTADAAHALREADRLLASDRPGDALLQLRVVEHAMPRIRDRLALRQAEALRTMGEPARACAAFALAAASPDRAVTAQGRIGGVHCLLEAGDRSGEEALTKLLRRYPHITQRQMLRFKLAKAREGWGQTTGAISLYRSIDLSEPASLVAGLARQAMARLRDAGVPVRALNKTEQVERTERLVKDAPVETARAAVEELIADRGLTGALRSRVHVMAAWMARREGRWDDVRQEVSRARALGANTAETAKLLPPVEHTRAPVDVEQATRAAARAITKITRGRPMRKLTNTQLRYVLDHAVTHSLKDIADEALESMGKRDSMPVAARFEAGVRSLGVAADKQVAALLKTTLSTRKYAVSGRYHYGRALERDGRRGEAEIQYLTVIESDRSNTRYYAMWAEQRLWAMHSANSETCLPRAAHASVNPKLEADEVDAMALLGELLDLGPVRHEGPYPLPPFQPDDEVADGETEAPGIIEQLHGSAVDTEALLSVLEPLSAAHGEGFPWLLRAVDLVQLGEFEAAADELNETYLAWRDARGSPRLRSGVEAVFTGSAPPRRIADRDTRRARKALDSDARAELSKAAKMLGDPGVALRFGTWRLGQRPRAYEAAVIRAAKNHGLDPNLLLAVMRVESIYNRRIVSYAGAVGLMQIMPRTGRLIADKIGVTDFEVTDLLDPKTNVEFSAWYLASLLRRWEGRLPLAIASYNGGPHNVRLWMRANHPDMPLDAFLERIPFTQTHRYVRRVLTHYAAYRAQKNLPMTRLSVRLPEAKPDPTAF